MNVIFTIQRTAKTLNNSFGQLLDILPTNHICSEIFHSEFSYIEVWFTDQNFIPVKLEARINLTLVIDNKGI